LEGRLQHELLDESSTSARRPILSISLCSEIELILRAYGHDSVTDIWQYIVQWSMGLPYLAQALYKSYHALPLRSHTTMDSPRALQACAYMFLFMHDPFFSLYSNMCRFSPVVRLLIMFSAGQWFVVLTCAVMLVLAFLGFSNFSHALPINDKVLHFLCFGFATGIFYFIVDVEEYVPVSFTLSRHLVLHMHLVTSVSFHLRDYAYLCFRFAVC
jgi:hypothetical protein